MKKAVIWFLVLISLTALVLRFSGKFAEIFLGVREKSGISVFSTPENATVLLNGREVGKTPYEAKDLEKGTYSIAVQKDQSSWSGKIKLNPGTVTVVNRDLAPNIASSAGEVLNLQKGRGFTVVSNPSLADIDVDGKSFGKTPAIIDVASGEHTILISRSNYLKRSIRANLPPDYNLIVAADLALSEADLSEISTPVLVSTQELIVKNTPTGFLRVRAKPSLAGKEIARVKPKDTLVLLEDDGGWFRVRLKDNTEGWVSSSYVEKRGN